MRLNAWLMFLLLVVPVRLTATTVKGFILANEMGGPPIANVEVSANDANTVRSLSNGMFLLEFRDKQPGETVQLIVRKQGMIVLDDYQLQFTLPKPQNAPPLILLLCPEAEREEWRARFYRYNPTKLATNHASEAAKEQLRIELDRAREEARRATEQLAREKDREGSDFYVDATGYPSHAPMALNTLGIMNRHQNRMQEARQDYDEALVISRKLAQKRPAIHLPDVALTLNNRGNLLSDQNQLEEARKDYDEALETYRDLAQLNPDTYLPSVATTLNNLGVLLRKQNRIDRIEDARKAFDEALETYRDRAKLHPDTYSQNVAETLNNLGILNRDQILPEESLKNFSEALAIYENRARENPGQYCQEVEATGRLLVEAFEETLESYRIWAQQNRAIYLPKIAATLNDLGALFRKLDQMEEARKAFDKALESYRDLAQLNPEAYLPYVAATLINLGTLNQDQNQIEEARKDFSEVPAINKIIAAKKALEAYRQKAETTLIKLGILSQDQKGLEEARKGFSEALAIYETLAKENPGQYVQEVESTRRLLDDTTDRRKP